MTNAIGQDIESKLNQNSSLNIGSPSTAGALWQRWFDTLGMRMGVNPETLYDSVEIDIHNVDSIVDLIGRDLDLPDQLVGSPDLLTLMSNPEVLQYLESRVGEGTQQNEAIDRNQALQEWMQDSKLVDPSGKPTTFYHGSFADISEFSKEHQGTFSRLGKGFYFTSNADDASDNYASPESPELQAKAQAIQFSLLQTGIPLKDIDYSGIKASLAEGGGAVYPVYLRMNRPFTIGNIPFHQSANHTAIPNGAVITTVISGHGGSMAQAQRLIKQLNACVNTIDATNVLVKFAGDNEFEGLPLQVIEQCGYDGVIDKSAGGLWHTPDDAEHFIVFNPTQIKSAIGNTGEYQGTNANILYQLPPSYDSVLFQFAGVNAKGAPISMLNAAKALFERGEDMETVRKRTGWHKWVDDKWRFEFPDKAAKLKHESFEPTLDYFDRQAQVLFGGEADFRTLTPIQQEHITTSYKPSLQFFGPLKDVLDHPKLFEHYPQFGQMEIDIHLHPDIQQKTGRISLVCPPDLGLPPDYKIYVTAPTAEEALDVIVHEIQHGIQNLEFFAQGGTLTDKNQLPEETKAIYRQQLSDLRLIFDTSEIKNLTMAEAAEQLGSLISRPSLLQTKTSSPKQLEAYAHKLECELRSPRTRYLYLAGEYEARQAENRRTFTEAELKKLPLTAFEHVDEKKLEVVINQSSDDELINSDYSEKGPLGSLIRNPVESKFLMLLSNSHNSSTFIHESSHAFLDIFNRLAESPEAPECIRKDYLKICEYLGATPDKPITRDQHEKWASTCEAYFLKDGSFDSCSEPLLGRLREAMKESYATADLLEVNVSDELTEVLDKMFKKPEQTFHIDFESVRELIIEEGIESSIKIQP